jgi:flagellar protein FlbD
MILDPLDEQRVRLIRQELEFRQDHALTPEEVKKYMPGIVFRRTAVIQLTKLNNQNFMLNPELIEMIESTPDTVITLVNGKKILVKETASEVKDFYVRYKMMIYGNSGRNV